MSLNLSRHIPKVGFGSLGCPKATVDSERILTRLRAEGYQISPSYDEAELVIVNTCGFIDEAVEESLETIGEALAENGKVIVTGCLGVEEQLIRETHPNVLAVTGPHQYEAVVEAVHDHLPPVPNKFVDLVPAQGLRLTPLSRLQVTIAIENSGAAVRACTMPPAARIRAATGSVQSGTSSANSREPWGRRWPAIAVSSLMATGIPSRGRADPAA